MEHRTLGLALYAFRDRVAAHLNRYPKASRFTRSCWAVYNRVNLLRSALDSRAATELRERFSDRLYYPAADFADGALEAVNGRITGVLSDFAADHLVTPYAPLPDAPVARGGRRPLSFAEHRLLGLDRTLFERRLFAIADRHRRSPAGRAAWALFDALNRAQLAFEDQATREPLTGVYALPLYWHGEGLPAASVAALNGEMDRLLADAVRPLPAPVSENRE